MSRSFFGRVRTSTVPHMGWGCLPGGKALLLALADHVLHHRRVLSAGAATGAGGAPTAVIQARPGLQRAGLLTNRAGAAHAALGGVGQRGSSQVDGEHFEVVALAPRAGVGG